MASTVQCWTWQWPGYTAPCKHSLSLAHCCLHVYQRLSWTWSPGLVDSSRAPHIIYLDQPTTLNGISRAASHLTWYLEERMYANWVCTVWMNTNFLLSIVYWWQDYVQTLGNKPYKLGWCSGGACSWCWELPGPTWELGWATSTFAKRGLWSAELLLCLVRDLGMSRARWALDNRQNKRRDNESDNAQCVFVCT